MNSKSDNTLHFSSFFTTDDIICNTEISGRDDIIRTLLERLALNRGIGNVPKAYKAVLEREAIENTMIAPGIAIPHARLASVPNLTVAVATSQNGIEFGAKEKNRAHVIILLLVPKDQPSLYLQALSALARIFLAKTNVKDILKLDTSDAIWQFFENGGIKLPDFVIASDIMFKISCSLQEHDTLEKAVNLFIKHNVAELPIVDKDGDLVGVASAQELFRVCLPDYILWMDDLSPILQFEPFTNVMRNESNVWLTEIMVHDYVTLLADAPAIQVALEMTKLKAQQAYIVRDKKLVGLVTISHLLNKVLRD